MQETVQKGPDILLQIIQSILPLCQTQPFSYRGSLKAGPRPFIRTRWNGQPMSETSWGRPGEIFEEIERNTPREMERKKCWKSSILMTIFWSILYLRWARGPPWNATSMVGLHHSGDCSCGNIKHALFLHFGWEWTRNGGIWGWVGSAQNSIRRKFIFSQNISDTISLSLKPRARAGNVNW